MKVLSLEHTEDFQLILAFSNALELSGARVFELSQPLSFAA